jgi:hypothetical protein
MTTLKYCVTTTQIKEWLKRFKNDERPSDLEILKTPRFFLSCNVPNSDEAHVCYGNSSGESFDSVQEVYEIVERVCANPNETD